MRLSRYSRRYCAIHLFTPNKLHHSTRVYSVFLGIVILRKVIMEISKHKCKNNDEFEPLL